MERAFVPIKFHFLIKLLSLGSLKRFNEAFTYRREEAGKEGTISYIVTRQLDADMAKTRIKL